MRTPIFAGFVGVAGETVWLDPAREYEDDAAVVLARPDLFNDAPEPEPEPVRRGPGRPRKDSTDKPLTDVARSGGDQA